MASRRRGSMYFKIDKKVSANGDVFALLHGDVFALLYGEEYCSVKYTRTVKQGDHNVTRAYYATANQNLVELSIPISASTMIQNGMIDSGISFLLIFNFLVISLLPWNFLIKVPIVPFETP